MTLTTSRNKKKITVERKTNIILNYNYKIMLKGEHNG